MNKDAVAKAGRMELDPRINENRTGDKCQALPWCGDCRVHAAPDPLGLAAALLARHATLDALYAALPALPARQVDALRAHRDRVFLNRRLVTIVTTVDVPTALATYRWASADTWTAGTLLAALGLRG
jgi:hypothetical protein